MMATRDEPTEASAPTDAETAYLAQRRTVRIAAERAGTDLPHPSDPPESAPGRAPVALAAAVATAAAAVTTLAPVVLVVMLLRLGEDGTVAVAASLRVAVAAWLLGHGVPLQVGSGVLGMIPLALTAFAAWRMTRAGVHVTRAIGGRHSGSWRHVVLAAGAVGVVYGLIGLVVNAAAAGQWADPVRSAVTLAVFGCLTAGYGSLRTTGVLAALLARIPVPLRDGCRAGAVAAALVLAAGAAMAGIAVALSGGEAADTLAAYGAGVAGQAGLTVICLAFVPNLAVWAAAYLLGPGFAVGADTVVRSSELAMGPLPAVPVFAGIPDAPQPVLGAVLLVLPTLAGAVGGWVLLWRRPRPSWPRLLGNAALAGPVAGLLLGLAALVSGGALGTGHLSTLGPVGWQVALLGAALVLPGSMFGAASAAVLGKRH